MTSVLAQRHSNPLSPPERFWVKRSGRCDHHPSGIASCADKMNNISRQLCCLQARLIATFCWALDCASMTFFDSVYKWAFLSLFALCFGVYFLHHAIVAFFFKTQNLKRRYGASWALVTGASSGRDGRQRPPTSVCFWQWWPRQPPATRLLSGRCHVL
jgi:hypothetical protein